MSKITKRANGKVFLHSQTGDLGRHEKDALISLGVSVSIVLLIR